jgi:hypothetical protein
MAFLSRTVSNPSLSLKLNHGFNYVFRFTHSLQSTSTDSTSATMHLDSESQQEDQG